MSDEIETLSKESRVFNPPKEIVENANVTKWMSEHGIANVDELYKKALEEREWFWSEHAKELEWYKPWDKILEWKMPYSNWFKGGKINIVQNALDRHMGTPIKDKVAYHWEGEPGDVITLTYGELNEKVCKFANALKKLGVKKGDFVGVYMPMILELPIAMLACAKIGAIHSVVFSGFSAHALADRLNDCEAKVLITADGSYRKGKALNIKEHADEALAESPMVKHCIVANRIEKGVKTNMQKGRDHWFHELLEAESADCKTEETAATDLLFLMYTSGSTGKPKAVQHVHGGYAVGISTTLKWVFDLKDDDVWWCAADIGWITGHSYIVYAPLMLGVTSVMYEGLPIYPEADRSWEIVEKYGVTVYYTAPTAVRLFMRFGEEWTDKHELKTLRLLGSVGEPINPEAWMWYHENIGKGRCPIMDTWWQTETGGFMITPLPITPLKPGSATFAFPSYEADILNEAGKSLVNQGGALVIKNPWPSMLHGLYKEPDRYKKNYWSEYEGLYLAGDVARKDDEGYFWIHGRSDDVLNVAGHRIGTAEVESALVSYPPVAEAAVVGRPDKLKGDVIVAFVILKHGTEPSEKLVKELRNHVSEEIGPIAKPATVFFVPDLPKTRSGKIMRRVIKALIHDKDPGDTSTLKDPEVVEQVKKVIDNANAESKKKKK